jgi:uncharacterized membrane protein YqjE
MELPNYVSIAVAVLAIAMSLFSVHSARRVARLRMATQRLRMDRERMEQEREQDQKRHH